MTYLPHFFLPHHYLFFAVGGKYAMGGLGMSYIPQTQTCSRWGDAMTQSRSRTTCCCRVPKNGCISSEPSPMSCDVAGSRTKIRTLLQGYLDHHNGAIKLWHFFDLSCTKLPHWEHHVLPFGTKALCKNQHL